MAGHIHQMLDNRESELRARIDELRAQLAPAEAELDDIKIARAALEEAASRRVTQLPANGAAASAASLAYWTSPADSGFGKLTMKQLVRKALTEEFGDGATARQLLDLFHYQYGRTDIIRSSLSPQLSRLRVENVIWRDGRVWRLEPHEAEPTIFGETHDQNEPPNGRPKGGSDVPEEGLAHPPTGLHSNPFPSGSTS